jgi:nickel/cobalt transporter (NiCoT) family protein
MEAVSAGASRWSRIRGALTPAEWRRAAALAAAVIGLHVVGFVLLLAVVVPQDFSLGAQGAFGVGLGITAYTLGLRHAFDADHIGAIDNTTRKLMADGQRPVAVGFWFALGHSSLVIVLAILIAAGARMAEMLLAGDSGAHQVLRVVGTGTSGLFLYVIGLLNLVALIGILRVFRRMREGRLDEQSLEAALDARGFLARILGRLTRSVTRSWQMFGVGLVFGLGFDTATEVSLLVLAGSGAVSGLPWYAVLVLPLLFASGMSLFDTLDGTFMNFAYQWAFSNPVRKVFYNLAITGLSIAVAFFIGTIELVGVLHDKFDLTDALTTWIADIDLDNVGYVIVGLFVVVWAAAIAYWRLAKVEQRWAVRPADTR